MERTVASDTAPEGQHTVHFALSNQSRSHPTVTLRMTVDKAPAFDGPLESKGLHNWHEMTLTLRTASHVIEVQETQTGANEQLTVDIRQETWVTVMFSGPPPSCSVTAQTSPVSFV